MGPELGHEHRHNLRNLRFSLPLTLVRRALRERHAWASRRRTGRPLAARVARARSQQQEPPVP